MASRVGGGRSGGNGSAVVFRRLSFRCWDRVGSLPVVFKRFIRFVLLVRLGLIDPDRRLLVVDAICRCLRLWVEQSHISLAAQQTVFCYTTTIATQAVVVFFSLSLES